MKCFRRILHRWRMWRSPSYRIYMDVSAALRDPSYMRQLRRAGQGAVIVCRTEDDLPPRERRIVGQVFYVDGDPVCRAWNGSSWVPVNVRMR